MEVCSLFGAGRWKTADFAAGDIMVFGMQTLHMSTTNVTNRARISADTRWHPAQEPADPRYSTDAQRYVREMAVAGAWKEDKPAVHGKADAAHVDPASRAGVTMSALRVRWGFPA